MPRGWFSYLAGLVGLRLTLDYCYVLFVSPSFVDHFFLPMALDFDPVRYALSLLVYLAGICVSSPRVSRVSNLFLFVAIAFVFAPLTSMYGLDVGRSATAVLATASSLWIVRGVTVADFGRVLSLRGIRGGNRLTIALCVIAVLVVTGWSVASGAAGRISFRLSDIYLNRSDLSGMMDVGAMAYFNLWTYKVFNVILFCAALLRRHYGVAVLALAAQVYFFGVTSHRMVLFLPVLSVGVWMFYRSRMGMSVLTLGVIAGLALVLGTTVYYGFFELGSIVIRRAFFVPASATFEWFAYFETHDHVFWTDRLLSGLASTQYTGASIPMELGEYLAPGVEISANNGFVSAGFAHAGFAGVAFYALILGLFSRACDRLAAKRVDIVLVAAVLVGPIRTVWSDSDLPTAFVSHGLLVGLVTLWIYGRGASATADLSYDEASVHRLPSPASA